MKREPRTLDLAQLVPDPTNERSESDKDAIARLADSIRAHGLLQRLLVRPLENGKYMVIAGHRRMQAAQAAGLTHVPVEVRDIGEDEARALQIVENLHREDVTPLDEARAFDRLRTEDRTVEDVATLVGHSARYVAQRLSLINLVPQARKALRNGTIRLGTAYLLARISNEKIQREALRQVDGSEESPLAVSRASSIIEQRFELKLDTAPFDPEDDSLVKNAPSCTACPKRAGNQPLLFEGADRESRCTDPLCFAKKTKAAGRQFARQLRKEAHTVHGIKASEEFFERRYRGHELKEKWVTPGQRASYESNLLWNKVLKEELLAEEHQTWVTHPDSGIVMRIMPRSRAMKVAKSQGHSWAGARTKQKKSAAEKRQDTEQKVKRLTDDRVTAALAARLDELTLDPHVDWLLDAMLEAARSDSLRLTCRALELKREREVRTAYGKEKEGWRDRLRRAISDQAVSPARLFLLVLMQEQGWHYRPSGSRQPALRERLLAKFKIDVAEVERAVRGEPGCTMDRKRTQK